MDVGLWVGLGQARTTSYNSITPSKISDTSFYDFNIVTAQYAFNLLSFQVFDFGLLWSWIRIGFQTRFVELQVVAIASSTSTFYSCSLVTTL